MADLDFPSSPSGGQQYTLNGITYYYDANVSAWLTRVLPYTLDITLVSVIANNAYTVANSSFSYVNTSTSAANNYSGVMANSSNAYAVTIGNSANNYAGVMANSSNAYADTVGISANNYSGVMANSANTWANTKLANTNVVLAGNLTSTQGIADRVGDLRNLPIVNQTSSYTLTLADHGEVISITTGNVFVTAGIFFPGNTISIFNNSSANITITQNTSVTMYSAGTANTGNRILQQRGIATLVCVAANTFVVTGAGMVS